MQENQPERFRLESPDQPWVIRTYSGHSSAKASNELFRTNLSKGQTGLSIAFDLPTQIGYDPEDPQTSGEVGKVGVPVFHLGHMAELLEGIPIQDMNTSMTINATAAWLLALYIANAKNQGVEASSLSGTTQNDIMKEYLSRGTFIFPPEASLRLIVDMIVFTVRHVPKWNPINICSYHLQEAGATVVQEIAFSLANAIAVLDAVKISKQLSDAEFPEVVGRISFFVNSGIRFIEEVCKMRAFSSLWDQICLERYGITEPKLRRFRYGVQVNSLGLTESQPENNITRIALETLGVTLSRDARARALQLPAWNEALGLPRPWDQQWSLRIQQILAYETDLLNYPDIFAGSHVIEGLTGEIKEAADKELSEILSIGGAFAAIDELKSRLVQSQSDRTGRIETADQIVVGVNRFVETEVSPLVTSNQTSHLIVDPAIEDQIKKEVSNWKKDRDNDAVARELETLARAARTGENIMDSSIRLALAGGTTGEWANQLREVFGEFRAPTGITGVNTRTNPDIGRIREGARALVGGPPRMLVAKPGLDGHSNGAEQIAIAGRDAGFEIIYQGIRLTPAQIAQAALDEDVDVVGISILSGSHLDLVPEVILHLEELGSEALVVVGGIIPDVDQSTLRNQGVAAIYTPKDFKLSAIMSDILKLVEEHRKNIE